MTRHTLLMTAIWLACMVPLSLEMAHLGEPQSRQFWRYVGVL